MTQQSRIVSNVHYYQLLFFTPHPSKKKQKQKPALCIGNAAPVSTHMEKLALGLTQVGTTQDLLNWQRKGKATG